MALKSIQYQPQGTCCKLINIVIQDDTVYDVEFSGGCSGNLSGIKQLIKGMKVEDVISRLEGIKCGAKSTSCPDQLAKGLAVLFKKEAEKTAQNV